MLPRLLRLQHVHRRLASTLIFAEHQNNIISDSFGRLVTACKPLGPVTCLVVGSRPAAEQAAKVNGVSKVLSVAEDAGSYSRGLENLPHLLAENVGKGNYTHLVAASSAKGKSVIPRVSALLDTQAISDVIEVQSEDTFVRPIFAGNALATVKSVDRVKLITLRASAFSSAETQDVGAPIEDGATSTVQPLSEWISESLNKSDRPDLSSAKCVVAGGRGLRDKETFERLVLPLADSLNAAVGASRAAVDSHFCDNSLQVGQTGKVVAPDVYIAVGVSGAIQHLAGMKDSKLIVAINKDTEAPIFQIADIGLAEDINEAVPELTKKIRELR